MNNRNLVNLLIGAFLVIVAYAWVQEVFGATVGTLEPHHLYFVEEEGILLKVLAEAQEDGGVRVMFPPDGTHTWTFTLWATPTPTPLLYPTSTPIPTNTPSPTPTNTPTPYPTFPPPPPTPVWGEISFNDIWQAINDYSAAYRDWKREEYRYQQNGWPTE